MFSERGAVLFAHTGCMIRACMARGIDDILFDSIDALLRWQQQGLAKMPTPPEHYRLFNRIDSHPTLEKGFNDHYGEGVTVNYDGHILTITAPTPAVLVERYNRLLRGE